MARIAAQVGRGMVALALAAALPAASGQRRAGAGAETAGTDPLRLLGYDVTGGAAPGYVEDRACGVCHRDHYRSYQQVGMARSFARPRSERSIERFDDQGFFHQPSGRHYRMVRDGDSLIFRRWQLDGDGRPINLFERRVDWVLGSGHVSRVYLFRTPAGELYQLPLAWYSQSGSWGMAPGFDRPDHQGVTRRVRRECMFCHNGYPDVPAGSDRGYWSPQTFPEHLPEGTGCQRCHGPGAEHLRLAFAGEDRQTVAAEIVDPGGLEPALRDDVCFQCHLQPSVVLPGPRRFGRGDYSYRPGEPLADYLVQLDVREEDRPPEERFEINHHGYRLLQSRCRLQSGDRLSCLTCHDPHRKVPPEERAAHYRRACLGCHQAEACRRQEPAHAEPAAAVDCVACHMPRRRTQDVVRVVMTDHRIQLRPPAGDPLAPLTEREPRLVDVVHLHRERAPAGKLGELYRVAPLMRMVASDDHLAYLERSLAAAPPEELGPRLDLAQGLLKRGRRGAAAATLRRILERRPDHSLARGWLALALARDGDLEGAAVEAARAVDEDPSRPEGHFNLGLILLSRGRPADAESHLERAVEMRPNFPVAWLYLGRARAALERPREAADAFRRALAVEPGHTRAYVELARTLAGLGERREALRYLRHGLTAAGHPEELAAELERLEAAAPPAP